MGAVRLSGSLTVALCLVASMVWLGDSARAGGPGIGMGRPCDGVKGPMPQKVTLPVSEGRRMEITCKNGKEEGTRTVWSQQGTKLRETSYREGVQHGKDRSWHENGRLASQDDYQNGTARVRKSWYETGEWESYGESDEKGDITYQVYWQKDGTLISEVGVPPAAMPAGTPRRERDPILPSVVRCADEYVIGKVGKEYFARNYRFLREKSTFHAHKGGSQEYFLAYEYKPLLAVGSDGVVRLQMPGGKVRPDTSFVANVEGGCVLEPSITRSKALEIAQSNFKTLSTDEIHVVMGRPSWMWDHLKNWTWAIHVTRMSAEAPQVGTTWTLFVDAVTGEYLGNRRCVWAR